MFWKDRRHRIENRRSHRPEKHSRDTESASVRPPVASRNVPAIAMTTAAAEPGDGRERLRRAIQQITMAGQVYCNTVTTAAFPRSIASK